MNNKDNNIQESKVIILMATYNGEEYIREQLDSIKHQSHKNWELIVRDDNSNDNTMNILKVYEQEDSRIKVLKDSNGNLGQCKNFDVLMQYALNRSKLNDSLYFMFSDQDDVWNNNKIELSIKKIISIENSNTDDSPILVYTNYLVSDSQLSQKEVAYKKPFFYSKKELASRLLIQNWVMGCTTIINKNLLKLAVKIPDVAENHDNWIAILCSLAGKIEYINEVTMTHRIHSKNVTTRSNTTSLMPRLNRVFNRFKKNNEYFQKKCFLYILTRVRVQEQIDEESRETLNNYKKIMESRGINAVMIAFKEKFYGVNKIQTTLFYLQLLIKRNINMKEVNQ